MSNKEFISLILVYLIGYYIRKTSLGQTVDAARTLSRRTDACSLMTTSEMYRLSNEIEMANATALIALKEASIKNDFDKIPPCISLNPQLQVI